jgi:serine-type D-Ala-D-Ala endopeptidase (penicillin-binding protein 7)
MRRPAPPGSLSLLACLLVACLVTAGIPVYAGQSSSGTSSPSAAKKAPAKKAPAKKAAAKKAPARTAAKAGTTRYSADKARERRLALARAKRAAYERQQREVATPQFKAAADGQMIPDVRAGAAIIYNPVTHEVLYESNAQSQRSIASITKVMTAVAFLENEIDLTRQVVVQPADVARASVTYLRAGERVTVEQLLHLLLIGSDNAAARVLARQSVYGPVGFIERMNQKAAELGLTATRYTDPSGLFATNVSSAFDMARLIAFASGDERVASIMRKANYQFSRPRGTAVTLNNTNKLVGTDVDVRGGKTGFISKAGYCLATLLRLPQGEQVAVVVLGAQSNPARFWETRHLVNWLASRTPALLATQVQAQDQDQ